MNFFLFSFWILTFAIDNYYFLGFLSLLLSIANDFFLSQTFGLSGLLLLPLASLIYLYRQKFVSSFFLFPLLVFIFSNWLYGKFFAIVYSFHLDFFWLVIGISLLICINKIKIRKKGLKVEV